jgi:hypothetical protein
MMYVGRGDYEATDWDGACEDIPMSEDKEGEIDQLLGKACLNDYLADGFESMNSARIL